MIDPDSLTRVREMAAYRSAGQESMQGEYLNRSDGKALADVSLSSRRMVIGGLAGIGVAAGIGAYALLGDNGINNRISGFDNRLSAVERRTQPVLDIRTYLLDGSCHSLGGQVAESNNDRQRNLTDCRFTQRQVGEDPHAFVRSVISPEYRDHMLRLADRPDDRSWDAFNSRNLERLLDRGYVGVIAQQAPQRAAPVAAPSQPRRTATTTRPAPVTQPQECATDYVNIRRGGFLGMGSINRTLSINDCNLRDYRTHIHNLTTGVCRNGFRVDGTFTHNPAQYIADLNIPGHSQRFNVTCYYPPATVSSGGNGGGSTGGVNCGGDCGGSTGGRGTGVDNAPEPGVN